MTAPAWLWLPIVLWAARAQTARNALQRSLVAQAGTLGATLSRFLYGIPFAALWVPGRGAAASAGAAASPGTSRSSAGPSSCGFFQ